MNPVNNFLLTPLNNERYSNRSEFGDKKLIISTSQEDHTATNRVGVVSETPIHYNGPIKKDDLVIIHHNVFRVFYDMKGRETSGPCHFSKNLYLVPSEQIYFYKRKNSKEWKSLGEYCFVKPINKKPTELLSLDKLEELMGEITCDNSFLNKLGVKTGDLVSFHPDTEYEFKINNETLYRIKNNRICVKMR